MSELHQVKKAKRKGIMLCYPYEERRLKIWGSSPFLVQRKLNGDRVRIIKQAGNITAYTSTGQICNFPIPHIIEAVKRSNLRDIELDGEAYTHGLDKSDIQSIMSRRIELHPDYEVLEYHVFDIVNALRQKQRYEMLDNLKLPKYCKMVKGIYVYTKDEIGRCLTAAIEGAYEGIVIRNLAGFYKRKRSTDIMKFKPRCVEFYYVNKLNEAFDLNKNPKNMLGSITCVTDGDQEFNVGAGCLSENERKEVWLNYITNAKIPVACEIEFQHTSKNVPLSAFIKKLIYTR